MGGAFVGLADGVESVYYNPAGLANTRQLELTGMYQTPMLQTSRSFAAFSVPWRSPVTSGSAALGWLRLRSTDIELTSADEQIIGAGNLTNDLILLGAGARLFEHVSAGASIKYFRFSFSGFQETGVGFDLGVQAIYPLVRFGFALTDLDGTTLKGHSIDPAQPDAADLVPMRFRPGIALTLKQPFGLPVDFNWAWDEPIKMQGNQETRLFTGAELWGFDGRAALRAGYQEQSGPTVGGGVRIGPIEIDYSYLFSLHLQDENRIGTTLRF